MISTKLLTFTILVFFTLAFAEVQYIYFPDGSHVRKGNFITIEWKNSANFNYQNLIIKFKKDGSTVKIYPSVEGPTFHWKIPEELEPTEYFVEIKTLWKSSSYSQCVSQAFQVIDRDGFHYSSGSGQPALGLAQ